MEEVLEGYRAPTEIKSRLFESPDFKEFNGATLISVAQPQRLQYAYIFVFNKIKV